MVIPLVNSIVIADHLPRAGLDWRLPLPAVLLFLIPNTQPLSAYCRGSYQAPRHGWGFSTRVKWVGAYTPEEYDPDSGTYIHATETLADYVIIDISTSLKIWNPLIMNFGIKNAGDYTHDRYGPFIGRAVYIELSTTLKGD